MTKMVAVTGVTGFIGKHIVDNLLSRGFTVRALTRRARRPSNNNVVWVPGALEDKKSLSELVRGVEDVVHCAGQVRGSKEETFTECNVTGSLNLMQAARENGNCKRFLFMSSLAARHPELSWYANSKYVAEQKLITASANISLGIFRPTAVYGPGDKELTPLFRWLLRGVLPQLGTPDSQLSFLHVSDLAEAVGQWLTVAPSHNHPYELCDGVTGGYNWTRLQEIGTAVRHAPVRLIGIPLPLLKIIADISTLSSRLIRQEPMLTRSKIRELTHRDWSASNSDLSNSINWFPKISLERALRDGLF